MSQGKSKPLKPFSLMIFTPFHMLEIPGGPICPKDASGWRQNLDKGSLGLFPKWLLRSLENLVLNLNSPSYRWRIIFSSIFVHPVCLISFRMVFGKAQWDVNPGEVHGFFNNSDSAESPQLPQMSIVHIMYWFFFPLSEAPLSFLLFPLIFSIDKGDTDLWGQRPSGERAI